MNIWCAAGWTEPMQTQEGWWF